MKKLKDDEVLELAESLGEYNVDAYSGMHGDAFLKGYRYKEREDAKIIEELKREIAKLRK